jgi:hypothetical protein
MERINSVIPKKKGNASFPTKPPEQIYAKVIPTILKIGIIYIFFWLKTLKF